jgi:hypothetical protein
MFKLLCYGLPGFFFWLETYAGIIFSPAKNAWFTVLIKLRAKAPGILVNHNGLWRKILTMFAKLFHFTKHLICMVLNRLQARGRNSIFFTSPQRSHGQTGIRP